MKWGRFRNRGERTRHRFDDESNVPRPASSTAWQQIAALALAAALCVGGAPGFADPALVAWGSARPGGSGRPDPAFVPLSRSGFTTAIAAGNGTSIALRSDGGIYAWGWNAWNRFAGDPVVWNLNEAPTLPPGGAVFPGMGDPLPSTTSTGPAPITLPDGVTPTAASTSGYESLALGSDGRIYAWGAGVKLFVRRLPPGMRHPIVISLPNGVHAVAIVCGGSSDVALGQDGVAYAWGSSQNGELGLVTQRMETGPTSIAIPEGVKAVGVAAGADYNLVLGSDGKAYGRGGNFLGELGNGKHSTAISPVVSVVRIPEDRRVTSLVSGWSDTLAITDDGALYVWGYRFDGPLGGPDPSGRREVLTPARIALPGGTRAVAASISRSHSMVLGSDGVVYTWGSDDVGQLGNEEFHDVAVPTPVRGLVRGTIIAVASGTTHSLALGSDGSVYGWGSIYEYGLGTGARESPVPAPILLPGAFPVASGDHHSLAVTPDGAVFAWGDNGSGQLGNGTTVARETPVAAPLPANARATAVSAGSAHSLALGIDGRVYAWGDNSAGQLGDGTTLGRTTPVAVAFPKGAQVVAVAAGYAHSLALTQDGSVYAWGRGAEGELGNGPSPDSPAPLRVSLPNNLSAVAISTRGRYSLALGSDHRVFAWGFHAGGSGGRPAVISLPHRVPAVAVSAGDHTGMALGTDGRVYTWDVGSAGGGGGTSGEVRPVALPDTATILAISAGTDRSLALSTEGTVYTWSGTSDRPVPLWLPAGSRATRISAGRDGGMALVVPLPGIPDRVLKTGNVSGAPGGTAVVPVAVEGGPLLGLTFTVEYDPALTLSAGDVVPSGLFDKPALTVTALGPGRTVVAMESKIASAGFGTAVDLTFHLPVRAGTGTLYPIHVTAAHGIDGAGKPLAAGTIDGRVVVAVPELPGDVNGDGVVDMKDVLLVLQAAVHLIELTPDQARAADVNGDGAVTPADATLILRKVLGRTSEFPARP